MVVPEQVIRTPAAEELMGRLEEKHGELMFHQSGGCCDGSSPMCYPRGEFFVGDSDVLMATLGETPFYMSRSQFEYWKHTQLILDVVPGRGGMSMPRLGKAGLGYSVSSQFTIASKLASVSAGDVPLSAAMSLPCSFPKLNPDPANLTKKAAGLIFAVAVMWASTSRTVQSEHNDDVDH